MNRLASILIIFGFLSGTSAFGQRADPMGVYNEAVSAIQAENWDAGLSAINGLFSAWGDRGKKDFGPVWGHFYYLRGLLQFGKENNEAAKESYRICYEDYSNEGVDFSSNGNQTVRPNQFRIQALMQWAGILMLEENFAEARDKFQVVMSEGRNSGINMIFVAVNLGRCLVLSGKLQEGYDYIAPVLNSPKASRGLKQTIFDILANDWSPLVEEDKVFAFLNEFRHVVEGDILERRMERNPSIQYLAQTALSENKPVLSLAWFSLLAHPADWKAELLQQAETLKAERPQDQHAAIDAKFAEDIQELELSYHDYLNAVGGAHFKLRNYSAGYAAFDHLAKWAPDYEHRPVVLHNSVASAVQIGKWREAYGTGTIFFGEFPDHELKGPVARMLVEVIFLNGEYEEAYRIAKEVREDMEPGSEIRDIPDFIVGASAFHLEFFDEAATELESYLEVYPKGQRREPAEYYHGSSRIKLLQWEQASASFDRFISTWPDSQLMSGALYQNGLAKFMLDQHEKSVQNVETLISRFPQANEIPAAWNLRGDLFVADETSTFDQITDAYSRAKSMNDERGLDKETSAYALWQLATNTIEVSDWDTIGKYYDEFQDKHDSSVFRLDMLASSLDALVELGRSTEGLGKLRQSLFEFQDQPESQELAQMFGTYQEFLKNNFTTEEALAELDTQLGRPDTAKALEGWLRVGKIEVLEGLGDQAPEEQVNQEYYALQNAFDPAEHSNFVIVKLCRWIKSFREKPGEAQVFYEYILENRPGSTDYDFALADVALIEADSSLPDVRAAALLKFEQILNAFSKDELLELATLGTARVHTENETWAEALDWWDRYREGGWTNARPEAALNRARALEQLGREGEARAAYVAVYTNFPGYTDWSTEAWLRMARLLKQAGEDRNAILVLRDMLQRIGHHDHPRVAQAREVFPKWLAEYRKKQEAAQNQ